MKNFGLWIVCVLSSALFWLKVKPWLSDPFRWSDVGLWLGPLLLLLFSSSLMALALFLLPKYYWRLAVLAGPLVFYVFLFGHHRFILLGMLVALWLGLWAMAIIKKEKENRLVFDLSSILKGGVCRLLTAIFVLISLAYFLTPGAQVAAQSKELPPGMARVVQIVVGNYISGQFKTDDPRFAAQVNEEVLNQLNTFLEPYFQYVPPILALSLFLVLQGLSLVFLWLTLLVSRLIFLILKWFKIITMGKVTKEADVVAF